MNQELSIQNKVLIDRELSFSKTQNFLPLNFYGFTRGMIKKLGKKIEVITNSYYSQYS